MPPDTDTPGFERENVGKPQETMKICESGGLFKPDDVAKKILKDALVSRCNIVYLGKIKDQFLICHTFF